MNPDKGLNQPTTARKRIASAVATVTASTALNLVLGATPAQAMNFETGEVNWSADITLGAGASWRVEDPETTPNSPNIKSDTTFDKGLVSNVYKITAELGADWRNYFAVANVSYTYDWMIMQEDTDRGGVVDPNFAFGLTTVDTGMGDDWNSGAEDVSGSVLDLLDAYIGGTFADDAVDARIGWQVMNWGEGLFFLDGVAEQTPLNIGKLVLPGSELKEAYVGVSSLRAQWAPTDILSLDAYVQFDWEPHTLPGVGTYYGDDIAGPGGFEEWSMDPVFGGLRGRSIKPDDSGQWGISGRAFIGDVEVGLYYSRYHEKFPLFAFSSNPASETLATVLYYVPELNGGLTPDDWAGLGVPIRPCYRAFLFPAASCTRPTRKTMTCLAQASPFLPVSSRSPVKSPTARTVPWPCPTRTTCWCRMARPGRNPTR